MQDMAELTTEEIETILEARKEQEAQGKGHQLKAPQEKIYAVDGAYTQYEEGFYSTAEAIGLVLKSNQTLAVLPAIAMAMNLGSKQEMSVGFRTQQANLLHVAKSLKNLTFRGLDFVEGLRDGKVKDAINSEPYYNCLFGIYPVPVKEPFRTDYEKYRGSQGAVFAEGMVLETKHEYYVGSLDLTLENNVTIPDWKDIPPSLNKTINDFDSIRYEWVYQNRAEAKIRMADMMKYKPMGIDEDVFKPYALILAVATFSYPESFENVKNFILDLAEKTVNGDVVAFKAELLKVVQAHKQYDDREHNISAQTILNKISLNPQFANLKMNDLNKQLASIELYVRQGMTCQGQTTKGLPVAEIELKLAA